MNKINFYIFLFVLSSTFLEAQNKRDYVWMNGRDNLIASGIENYVFDFNQVPFEVDALDGGLEFDNNNAIISDIDGNLLFYSNGCAVANRNHDIMPNGMDINEGEYFDIVLLGDCQFGYIGFQDIMVLPDPYFDDGYYLLTKPRIYNFDGPTFLRDIQYSYINMNLDIGLGDVTIKNQVVFDQDTVQGSYFHAVKHANEIDWWILQPSKQENRYLKFLIDSNGFNFHSVQEIGPEFHFNSSSAGSAKFSPDGSKYAYYNRHMQLLLYDFDRESGMLGNLKEIEIDSIPVFNTIEFSASGRFLYFALQTHLYQLDLEQLDEPDALVLIDEWDGVADPFATTFFLMQRGPDCRIYITPQSSSNVYHVINKPDEKGVGCDFVQRGISLPYTSGVGSLPNFPNFRIDEDEYCDPTLTSTQGIGFSSDKSVYAYPNPADDIMHIENIKRSSFASLSIYTAAGIKTFETAELISQIDLSTFPSGIYILKIRFKEGIDQNIKFIKL